jgi:hypothetical protein
MSRLSVLLLFAHGASAFDLGDVTSASVTAGSITGLQALHSTDTQIAFLCQATDNAGPPQVTSVYTASILTDSETGTKYVSWAASDSLIAGTYLLQAEPSNDFATATFFLHSDYTLTSVSNPLPRHSVAGRQSIILSITGSYESSSVVVRFSGTMPATQTVDMPGTVDAIANTVTSSTGAWMTPADW